METAVPVEVGWQFRVEQGLIIGLFQKIQWKLKYRRVAPAVPLAEEPPSALPGLDGVSDMTMIGDDNVRVCGLIYFYMFFIFNTSWCLIFTLLKSMAVTFLFLVLHSDSFYLYSLCFSTKIAVSHFLLG